MRLEPGRVLGHYRIIAPIGAGGMGEVYRAHDTRLDRTVALKILPTQVAEEPDRLRRFQREAKAASALSHPNAAQIYEIGETDGIHFIIMELVEGEPVSFRFQNKRIEAAELLEIAIQIADVLDHAHSRGITHRDLKPGNILLTSRRQIKLLDFGLAKINPAHEVVLSTQKETQSSTEPGLVLGTVPYMSPEQALGATVDGRSDLFSLGVVLYELATGRHPFAAATVTETIDRIAHVEPEAIARFNYALPPEMEFVIRKCLEKDPAARYQSAHELFIDLKNLQKKTFSASVAAPHLVTSFGWKKNVLLLSAIVLIVLFGIYFSRRNQPLESSIRTLAVLPFINGSADAEIEYLVDGITESLINQLSQASQLKVIARTSVFNFKSKPVDPMNAARQLKADVVLTGKVTKNKDTVVVQADLLEVASNSQLWGHRYNSKASDVLLIQEEISTQIAESLKLKLTRDEEKRIAKNPTTNPEAYELYLNGLFGQAQRTEQGLRQSIESFRKAIELDPGFALAYTGLARSYGIGIVDIPPQEAAMKARAAVEKALELDPELADAYASLGTIKMERDWDWPGAEQAFRRALLLNPSSAETHHQYSHYLLNLGRIEESLAESVKALELSPLDQTIEGHLAYHYLAARQPDQAIDRCLKILETNPNYIQAHSFLSMAYLQKEMFEEATSQVEKALARSPEREDLLADMGIIYARGGRKKEAERILDLLLQKTKNEQIPSYHIAQIFSSMKEDDRAFEWLERAFQERNESIVQLKADFLFDNLRNDPRFLSLLRRIRLLQ